MRQRAVTLSELVLSLFLLLLVVVLVFQLYPMAMASLRGSGQRVQANALADSLLTDYRQRPFSDLAVAPETPLPEVPGRGTMFRPSVEISPVSQPGTDPDRIRSIRIRVRWVDNGVTRLIEREQWRTDVQR